MTQLGCFIIVVVSYSFHETLLEADTVLQLVPKVTNFYRKFSSDIKQLNVLLDL